MNSLLLKNVLVCDCQSPYNGKKIHLYIKNGIIESFKEHTAQQVIDCSNLSVSPGFVDLNADFCDPGFEYKEDFNSGTKVAVHGGFTDVNIIANYQNIDSKTHINYIKSKSSNYVDLHPCASVSIGRKGENMTEFLDLYHQGASSFSDGDVCIANPELLIKTLQYTKSINSRILQFPRDSFIAKNTQINEGKVSVLTGLKGDPSLSEYSIIQRDLSILKYTGGKIHFSKISCAESLNLIDKAKKLGLDITCDVALYHLLFTDENLEYYDTSYKGIPPFRAMRDREALLSGIKKGIIDAISSNHRPQDEDNKKIEFESATFGSIALQTVLPVLLQLNTINLDLLIEKITHAPRKILNLPPIKVAIGNTAKLTIYDPNKTWVFDELTNQSKSKNSPFWNKKLKGSIIYTINKEHVCALK